jgi:myosin heavy subunit
VDKIAKLLGVSNNELSEALLTRVIAASGEVINQNDGF